MQRLGAIGLAGLVLMMAMPAQAQELEPKQRWDVRRIDGQCGAMTTYAAAAEVYVIVAENLFEFRISVSDSRWDVNEEDEPSMRFALDGKVLEGEILAWGADVATDAKPTYSIGVTGPLHAAFEAGKSLKVYRRDELIADLSLGDDVGRAMKALNRCIEETP